VNSDDLLRDARRGSRRYLQDLFPQQTAFFTDRAKTKAAVCGRRAGKTWIDAVGLHESAERNKRSLNPYICLSSVSARRIMWPVLEEFNDRYKLAMKMHSHELIAELPNGSSIFCVGGDDARKVEALRGGKYGRVVIDEAGSFPRLLLRYLCEDVLDAALMDLDGDMWLTGSPNAACVGYFYDITTGVNPDVAKVATYHWNVLDNVHIPHAAEWLERKRQGKNWGVDHPVFRREYLGHWVRDASSLVFRFDRARHLVSAAPADLRGVIGVDLGASETVPSTAFVVNAWAKYDRTTYAVYADKRARMNPMDTADEIRRLQQPGLYPNAHMTVVDEGGLGKAYADLWRQRCQIAVKGAEKKNKKAYVELLNGELDGGRIKFVDGPTRALVEEIELLQWDEDRKDYDDRFADHCADAWLYGWRECYAWNENMPPADQPKPGTAAYELARAAELKQQAIDESLRRAKREGKQMMRRYR
jgi:hypothetical protein